MQRVRDEVIPVSEQVDREPLLQEIIRRAAHLMGARSSGVYEYDKEHAELRIIAPSSIRV